MKRGWANVAMAAVVGIVTIAVAETGPATQARRRFTIGAETTRVRGPLRADGTIDYPAAADQQRRRGVTADNNAAALILQVVGRGQGDDRVTDEELRKLGLDPAKVGEGLYVGALDFARTHLTAEQRERFLRDFNSLPPREAIDSAKMPEVAAWVAANAKAFELLEAASRKERYFVASPAGAKWIAVQRRGAKRTAEMGLCTRAGLRIGDGDLAGAAADMETLLRLARITGRSGDVMSLTLAAHPQNVWALEPAWLAAGPDKELLRTHLKALRETAESRLTPEAIDVYERYAALDDAMGLARGDYQHVLGKWTALNLEEFFKQPRAAAAFGVEDLKAVDLDGLMRRINAEFDVLVAVLREPDTGRRDKTLAALEAAEAAEKFPGNFVEEVMGKTLLDIAAGKAKADTEAQSWETYKAQLVAAAGTFAARRQGETAEAYAARMGAWAVRGQAAGVRASLALFDMRAAQRRVSLAAVAVAAYKADRGSYPAELAALKGAYLDEVPVDPFTGQALVYRLAGGQAMVYSVGPDGKDDGGKAYDWKNKSGDVVVRVGK